jgi:hypothetical protein
MLVVVGARVESGVEDKVGLLVLVVLDGTTKVVGVVLVDGLSELIFVVVALIEPSTNGAELIGLGEAVLVVELLVVDDVIFVRFTTVIVEFTVADDRLLLLLLLAIVGLIIAVAFILTGLLPFSPGLPSCHSSRCSTFFTL